MTDFWLCAAIKAYRTTDYLLLLAVFQSSLLSKELQVHDFPLKSLSFSPPEKIAASNGPFEVEKI